MQRAFFGLSLSLLGYGFFLKNTLRAFVGCIPNCGPEYGILGAKNMTNESYLLLAEAKWEELEQLKSIGDFYNYEKRFAKIWVKMGRSA